MSRARETGRASIVLFESAIGRMGMIHRLSRLQSVDFAVEYQVIHRFLGRLASISAGHGAD